MRAFLPMLAAASILATPALAQTVTGYSVTNAAGQTATTFQVQPQARLSAADYVKMSADAQNYTIAASKLAASKSQRADVRNYAKMKLAAAEKQQGALMAALKNQDRTIARPSSKLSSTRQASLDLLRKAPRASFDNLYLTQMTQASPTMWALQAGYAADGSDPVLRQVATLSAPAVERDYTTARGLMPAALVR